MLGYRIALFWLYLVDIITAYAVDSVCNLTQNAITLGAYGIDADKSFDGVIKIGIPVSLICDDAISLRGNELRNGYELLSKLINIHNGGIQISFEKYELQLQMIQVDCSARLTTSAMHILEKYTYFLGPLDNTLTNISLSYRSINADSTILIAPAANDPTLYRDISLSGYGILPEPMYEHIAFQFTNFLSRSMSSAIKLKFAVLDDGSSNYCSNSTAYTLSLEYNENIEFVGYFNNISTIESLSAVMKDLQRREIDVIFGCTLYSLCTSVINTAKLLSFYVKGLIFSDCVSFPQLYSDLGVYADNLFGIVPWTPEDKTLHSSFFNMSGANFKSIYRTTYGVSPTYYAASAFAAGEIFVRSIQAAGNNVSQVKSQLRTSLFDVIMGNVTFMDSRQSTLPLVVVQTTSFGLQNIVFKNNSVTTQTIVFPIPSLTYYACVEANKCSGHGTCNSLSGQCECEYGFYKVINACDTYCNGTYSVNSTENMYTCIPYTLFYVGAFAADSTIGTYGNEIDAVFRFTADLLNRKLDDWFSNETKNVYFTMDVFRGFCTSASGTSAFDSLTTRAAGKGLPLSGFIGAQCSSTSKAFSNSALTSAIPQISYISTNAALSDKKFYPYFNRVAPSDSYQALVLAQLLVDMKLNLTSLIYSDDFYASNLATNFMDSYKKTYPNGIVYSEMFLLDSMSSNMSKVNNINYETTNKTINAIIIKLLASGAPTVVFITGTEQYKLFFTFARENYARYLQRFVFFGGDALNSAKKAFIPIGSVATNAASTVGTATETFMKYWSNASASDYEDDDKNRSTLNFRSYLAIDAFISLAIALQKTLEANSQLVNRSLDFNQRVVTTIHKEVMFNGTTGSIKFDESGDTLVQAFDVFNMNGDGLWKKIGIANKADTSMVKYSDIIWPNGQKNANASYIKQFMPLCNPGYSPSLTYLDNKPYVYQCFPCAVNSFKYIYGSDLCMPCPLGTECSNIAVTLPCIMAGYWRDLELIKKNNGDMDNFVYYPVYECDLLDSCIGNCNPIEFSNSNKSTVSTLCASSSAPDSTLCGVCSSGYYQFFGSCRVCVKGTKDIVNITYTLFTILLTGLIASSAFFIYRRTLKLSDGRIKDFDSLYGLKEISRTLKLCISFVQVLTGTLNVVKLKKTGVLLDITDALFFDPLSSIFSIIKCSSNDLNEERLFELKVTFSFLMPLMFIISLFIFVIVLLYNKCPNYFNQKQMFLFFYSTHTAQQYNEEEDEKKEEEDITNREIETDSIVEKRFFENICNSFFYIFIWTLLLTFPFTSSTMIFLFHCRDLSPTGSFMTHNYAINCTGEVWNRMKVVSFFAIMLCTIFTPVIFTRIIYYRHSIYWNNAAKLLYQDYNRNWEYFEVYNLIRRLMLSSTAIFVGYYPAQFSQALFLLMIGIVNFVILLLLTPLNYFPDNILASMFAFIEMLLFLLMLISTSNNAKTEHFDTVAFQNCIGVLIILILVIVLPVSLAWKIPILRRKIIKYLDDNKYTSKFMVINRKKLSKNTPTDKAIHTDIDLSEIKKPTSIATLRINENPLHHLQVEHRLPSFTLPYHVSMLDERKIETDEVNKKSDKLEESVVDRGNDAI